MAGYGKQNAKLAAGRRFRSKYESLMATWALAGTDSGLMQGTACGNVFPYSLL